MRTLSKRVTDNLRNGYYRTKAEARRGVLERSLAEGGYDPAQPSSFLKTQYYPVKGRRLSSEAPPEAKLTTTELKQRPEGSKYRQAVRKLDPKSGQDARKYPPIKAAVDRGDFRAATAV